jgi:RHS repeat-associated protein
VTSYQYFYDTGSPYKLVDPKLNAQTFTYSSTYYGAYPTIVTNALNQSTTLAYDFNSGLLTTTTDPNGQTSSLSYDPLTLRNIQEKFPDGGTIGYCYSDTSSEGCASGPPYQVTITRSLTSSSNFVSTEIIDGLARSAETEINSDPSGTDYTVRAYDADGRLASETNPYRTSGLIVSATQGTTGYQYDALNRPTLITRADGSTVKMQYCGSTTLVTDEAGHWRRGTTDGLGRLVEVDEPNSTTAMVNVCPVAGEPIWVTTYNYDALNNLVAIIQGGSRQRAFAYDSLKRLTSSTNPEAGNVTYTYDANSNVHTKSDARGVTITYAWDALNRMLSRTYSNGDPTVTYTYDQATCVVVPSCYNIGRRTKMTDGAGSESWAYDKMGRESGEQRTTNGVTKNASYTYNLDGSLATLTYPSGTVSTYTYNSAAEPVNMAALGNPYFASNGYYTPSGGLMTLTIGGNLTTIYNQRLQPCWIYQSSISTLPWNYSCTQTTPTNGNILDVKYNYNLGADNGNVIAITNDRDTTRSQSFIYDQVNRIQSAQSSSWSQTFNYDQWGNLLSASATGSAPPLPLLPVNANNQITTTGFKYDLAGNETSDVTSAYVWNADNEIKTAAAITYTYDGDGNRVQKSNGKIYWYGSGAEILDESDASGNFTDEYVYFGDKRVAHRVVSSNAIYYYAQDMLGSSRGLAPSGGTLCYDADFYPFGGEHNYLNTCPQNYKFAGKERDPETSNDDFGARYYSSTYGRFLSADWSSAPSPVPYANLTNPQTLNLYAIVADNPSSFADLDGHCGSDDFGDFGCQSVQTEQQDQRVPQPALKTPIWKRLLHWLLHPNPGAGDNSRNPVLGGVVFGHHFIQQQIIKTLPEGSFARRFASRWFTGRLRDPRVNYYDMLHRQYNRHIQELIDDYQIRTGKAMKDWDAGDFEAFVNDIKGAGGDTREFLARLYSRNPEVQDLVESAQARLSELEASDAVQAVEKIATQIAEACEEGGCEVIE